MGDIGLFFILVALAGWLLEDDKAGFWVIVVVLCVIIADVYFLREETKIEWAYEWRVWIIMGQLLLAGFGILFLRDYIKKHPRPKGSPRMLE